MKEQLASFFLTMRASPTFLVLEHILHQAKDEDSTNPDLVKVALAVVSGIALVCILFFVARFFVLRGRTQTRPRVRENGAPTENEYLMYAYLQTQPPSVARMHRLANADGLTAPELNEAAPVKTFSKLSNSSEDNVCAVCLEEMEVGAKTRKMPCGHEFDAKCIEEWVWKANRCPVCNTHVVDEEALQKRRFAAIQGRDPSPRTGRHRRRRIRGEDGVYEIRSGLRRAANESSPHDSQNEMRNPGGAAGSSDLPQADRTARSDQRQSSTSVEQAAEGGHTRSPLRQVSERALQPAQT